jgi:hypothetical protein
VLPLCGENVTDQWPARRAAGKEAGITEANYRVHTYPEVRRLRPSNRDEASFHNILA